MSDKRLAIDPAGVRRRGQHSISARVIRRESAVKPAASTALARFAKGFACSDTME